MIELRCYANVLFGKVSAGSSGNLEVKCKGKWCGHAPGVVVLHLFDLSTGQVVSTERFQDPHRILTRARSLVMKK